METERIELISVGVDIGSSTSHLAFSNLVLERDPTSPTLRFVIQERQILYEGRIIDTPLLGNNTIDITRLSDFLREEYANAGMHRVDVQSGAVIITGETAKKENAREIVELLSKGAGSFVAATAGANFESLITALGSGAAARSRENKKTILSCDIGGGTSNMAVSRDGEVVSTACVSVGGRLLALDSAGRISRLEGPVLKVMEYLGLRYRVGDRIPAEDMERIAASMAGVLVEVLTRPATSDLARRLMVTDDLDFPDSIDEYSFSGGVAELIYGGNGNYNDLGPMLARQINKLRSRLRSPVVEPDNKIRATVIGAGAYSLSISGSSGFMDSGISFPIKNIPVIRVDVEEDRLSVEHVVSETRTSFRRFDLREGEEVVALYFKDPVRSYYPDLELFAKSIEAALPDSIKKGIPIILVFEKDIACSVGNVIRRETGLKTNLLSLDELSLKEGDWIDIGEPLVGGQVFPVTVKSLAFNRN